MDITQARLERLAYDVWHDRAVFHFLTALEQRITYARNVARAVKPGGHVIVSTFGPEGPAKCSGLDVMRYDAGSLHGEFGARFRLVESSAELHQTPLVIATAASNENECLAAGAPYMPTNPNIRRARPEEAPFLTALTLRSKAHWGYDDSFMAAAKDNLTFRPEKFLPDFCVYILEENGQPLGFCSLILGGDGIELHDLFVEPHFIGKGYGKELWNHAARVARDLGFSRMTLTADPNAGLAREVAHRGA